MNGKDRVPFPNLGVFDWTAVRLDHLAAQAIDVLLDGADLTAEAHCHHHSYSSDTEQNNKKTN